MLKNCYKTLLKWRSWAQFQRSRSGDSRWGPKICLFTSNLGEYTQILLWLLCEKHGSFWLLEDWFSPPPPSNTRDQQPGC
jgi:hypothetical protein